MKKIMVAVVAGAMALGAEAATVYTGVDYIRTTRYQSSLPTGYYPNPKTWMEISLQFSGDFQLKDARPTGTVAYLFSAYTDANSGIYAINFGGEANQNNVLIVWAESTTAGSDQPSFDLAQTVMARNTLTFENNSLKWGTQTANPVPKKKTTTCLNPLYLLGGGSNAASGFGAYEMTVWSWKIYESDNGKKGGPNEVLVHDYVPAKDANGVAGLYDKVDNAFLASTTATPFTAGPDNAEVYSTGKVFRPTLDKTAFTYTGEAITPEFETPAHATASGDTSATLPGEYEITLTLDPDYFWDDLSTEPLVLPWKIAPAQNGWTTVPSVSRTRYVVGDEVALMAGEPKFGEVVATLDGEPFDPATDALPQEPGDHTLIFTVPDGEAYGPLYYAIILTVSGTDVTDMIGTRSLPSDYVSLDYISSETSFSGYNKTDGGAYIKLDFALASTDRVQTKVVFAEVANNATVFCMQDTTATESYTLFRITNTIRFDYKTTQIASGAGTVSASPSEYAFDIYGGKVYANGGETPFIDNSQEPFEVSGSTLYLFVSNNGSSPLTNFAKMRMYYFYVFNAEGKVTHELVPAKRKSDTVVGLYDLRTDVFWPSANISRAFNAPAASDANFLTRLASSPNRANSSPYASGGDVILYDGNTYAHIFTNTVNPGVFALVKDMPQANILVIGGGGGGGNRGSGGGGGGFVETKDIALEAGEYDIIVGGGGGGGQGSNGSGKNGGDSVVSYESVERYHAFGGGLGKGGDSATGGAGGSGVEGQGFAGGTSSGEASGGGGGAGAPGGNVSSGSKSGVAGGSGRLSTILGFEQYFAGGGGTSGKSGNNTGGAGGKGGGGSGSGYSSAGKPGVNGLGGGGAGGGGNSNFQYFDGGKGGDGIVIITYQTAGVPKPAGGKIARPTAISGLVYNGSDQTGVAEGAGYTLEGHIAALGGDHTAIATLEEGFEWTDGSTEPAEIAWFIAAAENAWTPAPAISTQHYGKDQVGDVVLTAGVTRYGEAAATIAKDGGEPTAFGGALPAVPGAYELTYFVDADQSWTGLTNKLTFTVYPFEIKPWANSFIADLTTNANRVVGSEFATGGDMVLKYPGKDGARDTYVHVFTDTSADSVFTVAAGKRLADAEILVVGGGGGAGNGSHSVWTFYCAGGGAGGEVVVTNGLPIAKTFSVHVGNGGAGGGSAGGESSFASKNGTISVVAQGGQGGLSNNSETYGIDGAPATGNGGAGQPNGGGGADANGHDGTEVGTLGYNQYFGGGGAGGTHSVNGGGTYTAKGGKGGGGDSSSDSYAADNRYGRSGTAGLGGGGAGGWMQGGNQDSAGRAGGSGIVAIRYSKVSSAGLSLFVK